jgi:hypothetical protein
MSLLSTLTFFIIGLVLLSKVNEIRGKAAALRSVVIMDDAD